MQLKKAKSEVMGSKSMIAGVIIFVGVVGVALTQLSIVAVGSERSGSKVVMPRSERFKYLKFIG